MTVNGENNVDNRQKKIGMKEAAGITLKTAKKGTAPLLSIILFFISGFVFIINSITIEKFSLLVNIIIAGSVFLLVVMISILFVFVIARRNLRDLIFPDDAYNQLHVSHRENKNLTDNLRTI